MRIYGPGREPAIRATLPWPYRISRGFWPTEHYPGDWNTVERSANGDEPLEARRNFVCRYAGTGERALKKNLCHKPSLTVREQCRRGQWIDVLPRLHFSA